MAGDQVAFAALVTRHHAPLLGYLYRLVGGDRLLAEDLVQETFLRMLRQRTCPPDRPFKPWRQSRATRWRQRSLSSARNIAWRSCCVFIKG
ncbi:MAG TPA: sigma factor [Ktedonobacterales bacterium]